MGGEVRLSKTFRLGTQERFKMSKLFCVGDYSILDIFNTNSFTVNQSYCGLYVKTSRINHAVREIAADEEITISYIGSNLVGFLNFDMDKFALLWGEAQMCLPYVCFYRKKRNDL